MLEQTAEVITAKPGETWVRAVETSGCGTCGGRGCATRRLAELFRRNGRSFRVDNTLDLAAGERVVVGMPEGSVLAGAGWAYGLPLVAMLGGALLTQVWMPGDGPALAGLLAGAALAYLLLRRVPAARPVVLRRDKADVQTISIKERMEP